MKPSRATSSPSRTSPATASDRLLSSATDVLPSAVYVLRTSVQRAYNSQLAALTLDMLKSGTRSAGIAVRGK